MAQEAEIRARRGTRKDKQPGTILFTTYFEDQWLPNRVGEVSTLASYRSHFRAALEPEFGGTAIEDITHTMIQKWVARQVEAGVRPGTVRAHYRTLATILGAKRGVSAVRDGLIDSSPCSGIDLPYAPARDIEAYTVREIDLLVLHIDAWWRPLLILAIDSGLRWGELMGLEVRDFSVDYANLTVRRTVVEVPASISPSGFVSKPYPKARKYRTVALSAEGSSAVAELVTVRGLSRTDRLFSIAEGARVKRTEQWPGGLPPSRSSFGRSVWKPAHQAAGVRQRRFHDLRVTHITWLLSGGADVSAVMRRVGHTRLSTTQVYLAALPDADARAVNALNATRERYRR